MKVISKALWNFMFLQVLIGMARAADPVVVYFVFFFDITISEYISWTLKEESTGEVVRSVEVGTYTSMNDFVELIELVPGETYLMEVVDNSRASIGDRFRGTLTDLTVVISEPPEIITAGQIAPGETKSYVLAIPDAALEIIPSQEPSSGPSAIPSSLVSPSMFPSMGAPISSIVSSLVPSSGTSMAAPSQNPFETPSQGPSEAPSTIPSSEPSPGPSMEAPSQKPFDLSSQGPSEAPPSCASKGGTCNSNTDCCSGRCSPQKKCFSKVLSSRLVSNRNRISDNSVGGAAGSQFRLSGLGGTIEDQSQIRLSGLGGTIEDQSQKRKRKRNWIGGL